MNIEQAIEWLKAISATQNESIHKNSLSERKEALYMAIKALEKQIPKNPIIHTNDIDKGRLACCPVCDSNVDWTYEGFWRKGNSKYCKNCGQAIDWT